MERSLDAVQPNTVVGPYRIVRGFRGRGGMARVFEVEVREKYRRPGMPPRLALKVALPEHQQALSAEADYLRRFDHPNVVRIFPLPLPGRSRPVYAAREQFPFGWGWYYTMELLDGGVLETRLTSTPARRQRRIGQIERPLSVYEALGIARQITSALIHIHSKHVVNLDVKPSNILFRRRRFGYWRSSVPQAVLADFGIARDTRYPRAGLLGVATPEYVSPEHAREASMEGKAHPPVDQRSDIFSLGVVLYEMLTGHLPFASVELILDPWYKPKPPKALRRSIPSLLDEIVMRALQKNPAERFQSAQAMYNALMQVHTPPDWPRVRRYFAAAVVGGGLVVGGMWAKEQITPLRVSTSPTPTAAVERIAAPTSTLVPTPTSAPPTSYSPTASPPPTATPLSTPTRPSSPVSTGSPTPPTADLVLLEPISGVTVRASLVRFAWQGTLRANESFVVRMWNETTNVRKASGKLDAPVWRAVLDPVTESGKWHWRVAIVRDGAEVATSEEQIFFFFPD